MTGHQRGHLWPPYLRFPSSSCVCHHLCPLVQGCASYSLVLVAGKVKGLFVWPPESRHFPAVQRPWTLLSEYPRTGLFHPACSAQLCSPTVPIPLHSRPARLPLILCRALVCLLSWLPPVLVVTALPWLGDVTVLEGQCFLPSILFVLEAKRGRARASQGHTAASHGAGLLTSKVGLLGLVLKCFETCPYTFLADRRLGHALCRVPWLVYHLPE